MATYQVPFPIDHIPGFRVTEAVERGVEKNLLFKTWGGLGDQICAEPTLRYALTAFKNCRISLASEVPELFAHLKFADVFDLRVEKPHLPDYYTFETISHTEHLLWQFMSHCVTNCVDFSSICAYRCQLPVAQKNVILKPETPKNEQLLEIAANKLKYVGFHCGKHWPSKTFPVKQWDDSIDSVLNEGHIPVLFGKEIEAHQGTVATKTEGCIDLRNKTTIMDSIWLLQQLPVLICNDSSPMHMAVSGNAWIGFIATCKHPDYIMHWRKNLKGVNEWAWRMENLGVGGMWELTDNCPNKMETSQVDECDPEILKTFLPDPKIIGPWCTAKIEDYINSAK